MTTSYTNTQPTVNPYLTTPLRTLLDLLRDLSAKRGYSWAHNEWLAKRLNCTPRTITRQIAALIRAGYITIRRAGNERHIQPTGKPTDKPKPKRVSHTLRNSDTPDKMSTRCLPPSRQCVTKENNIPPAPTEAAPNDVVNALQAEGIAPTVAKQLADSDPDECKRQIEAVKTRTGIINKAGYIVAAIKGRWKHQEKKHDAPTARPKRFAASPTQPEEPAQKDAEAAYEALSDSEKRQLEAQVIPSLSVIARSRRHIIQAACIQRLRAPQDAVQSQPAPTCSAPAYVPTCSTHYQT